MELEELFQIGNLKHIYNPRKVSEKDMISLTSFWLEWIKQEDTTNLLTLDGRSISENGFSWLQECQQRADCYLNKFYCSKPIDCKRTGFPPLIDFSEPNTYFSNDPGTNHKDRSVATLVDILKIFGIKKNKKSGKEELKNAIDHIIEIVSQKNLEDEELASKIRSYTPKNSGEGNRCSTCNLPTKGHFCNIKILRVWEHNKASLITKFGTFERFSNPDCLTQEELEDPMEIDNLVV